MQNLHGRKRIYTDIEVNKGNAVKVLTKALSAHMENRTQIEYLYDYYKGNQPILKREKTIRDEICNKIVINRANEIVNFKDGYLIGEPVQYISRGESENANNKINDLNGYMQVANKRLMDIKLVKWMHVCGVGYRMALPNDSNKERPFNIVTLDPRCTFVIYLNDVQETPQMAVTYAKKNNNEIVYSCYIKNAFFKITGNSMSDLTMDMKLTDYTDYISPNIPIIEFSANDERLGAFEIVISLLDAINLTESNRLDGIEQFIQSFMVFTNTDIDAAGLEELKAKGAIKISSVDGRNADVKYLNSELNQEQTQTLIDDMYETVLTICGMPNRNGGSSTSDTGSAVIMRDGWSNAEGRAKTTEGFFESADNLVLENILHILDRNSILDLRLIDVETKFTRRNYENLTIKVNALVTMLNSNKVHPLDAFQSCGLFIDPEAAYQRSKDYEELNANKLLQEEIANMNIAKEGENAENGNNSIDDNSASNTRNSE